MTRRLLHTALLLVLGLLPLSASAKRVSPLEGQPAVRHKHELRSGRFEIGPAFSISMNRYVRHAFTVGAKLEYHINDYFSVGANMEYGIGFDTSITGELEREYVKGNAQAQW